MAVDNEKLAKSRPGYTPEENGDGKVRPAGLYRHPGSGAEVITLHDPLFGDTQSAAAERVGFEFVRDVEPGEIKTVVSASDAHAELPSRQVEQIDSYNKGLEARLNALEAHNARLESQVASGNPVPGTEAVKGAEQTKEAAAEKVEEQTGTKVDVATGDVASEYDEGQGEDETSFKDLQAEAKELGVSAKGSKEELTQRVAEAKAEKENENE